MIFKKGDRGLKSQKRSTGMRSSWRGKLCCFAQGRTLPVARKRRVEKKTGKTRGAINKKPKKKNKKNLAATTPRGIRSGLSVRAFQHKPGKARGRGREAEVPMMFEQSRGQVKPTRPEGSPEKTSKIV